MKGSSSLLFAIVSAIFVVMTGCAKPLGLNYVVNFRVEERGAGDALNLHISGLVHSGDSGIYKVVTVQNGKTLVIEAYIGPSLGKFSGNIDYDLKIPRDVDRVCFGDELNTVWKRKL